MSRIIYNEDFISITWEIKEFKTIDLEDIESDNESSSEIDLLQEKQKQLHLIFTIQVNWKLKTFEWFFTLKYIKEIEEYSLQDWWEWYAILNLFTALGYKIWDYELWQPWSWIINQWTYKLLE